MHNQLKLHGNYRQSYMHPLIKDLNESSEAFTDLLKKYENEDNPLISEIKNLLNALTDEDRENACNRAGKVNLLGADPELAILFLFIWGNSSKGAERKVEFEFIKKMGFSLVSEKTPIFLKEYLETLDLDENVFSSNEDLWLYKEKLILKSPDQSYGKIRRLFNIIKTMSFHGFVGAIRQESNEILKKDEMAFKTFSFLNAVEVCDIKLACQLMPYLKENNNKNKYLSTKELEEYSILLQLLISKDKFDEKIILKSNGNRYWKKGMLATLYLFQKQEKKAWLEMEENWVLNVNSSFFL